jgi:hypothetical protein
MDRGLQPEATRAAHVLADAWSTFTGHDARSDARREVVEAFPSARAGPQTDSLDTLFARVLAQVGLDRPAYRASLGRPVATRRLDASWPPLLHALYRQVAGTRADTERPALLDFIPGYRLLHVNELEAASAAAGPRLGARAFVFLSDDAGARIAVIGEGIFALRDELDAPVAMHRSARHFLTTLLAFQRERVYTCDADGRLRADFLREGAIAAALNPGVLYWSSAAAT